MPAAPTAGNLRTDTPSAAVMNPPNSFQRRPPVRLKAVNMRRAPTITRVQATRDVAASPAHRGNEIAARPPTATSAPPATTGHA
jgi:hypothetical protein